MPSEAPYGHAHGGRFLPTRLAGVFRRRPLSGALALGLTLGLAACAADEIEARAFLQDYGLHRIAVTLAPSVGRPCRFGEPYAVRFSALDEREAPVRGFLCAVDEKAHEARVLFDGEGA